MTLVKNERNAVPFGAPRARRIASIVLTDTENGLMEVSRPGNTSIVEQPGAYFNSLLRQRGVRLGAYRLSPVSNAIDVDAALARIKKAICRRPSRVRRVAPSDPARWKCHPGCSRS